MSNNDSLKWMIGPSVARQVEEIETLCSIYGSDWTTEDEASRAYSITIREGKYHVTMFITLPADYPQCCPPTYELLAPELSGYTKRQMNAALDHVYLENIGEPVIFQWVEKIRDILQNLEGQNPTQEVDDYLEEEAEMCGPAVFMTASASDISSDASKLPVAVSKTVVIKHGPVITDRKSVFQGHAATVHSVEQVKEVLEILKENKKIANATHNMFAYRIAREGVSEAFLHDCEDDGETQAGTRLLHLLQVVGAVNAVVIVTRWYGGVHLGPDRFRHINNAARQALNAAGLITQKHKATH